jgi:Zn-dependent peptidase ImmA (M78 family)
MILVSAYYVVKPQRCDSMGFATGYVNQCFLKEGKDMNCIRDAEAKAREILDQYDLLKKIPIDPVNLARLNNIEVRNVDYEDNGFSGAISKKNGVVQIFVKSADSYNRKRFTVAHELGHFFLHMQSVNEYFIVDTMFRTPGVAQEPRETAANAFAAALLMDSVLVKSLWNDLRSVQIMADVFKVSYESMAHRLENLGLFNERTDQCS